jgi:hypothetical protein
MSTGRIKSSRGRDNECVIFVHLFLHISCYGRHCDLSERRCRTLIANEASIEASIKHSIWVVSYQMLGDSMPGRTVLTTVVICYTLQPRTYFCRLLSHNYCAEWCCHSSPLLSFCQTTALLFLNANDAGSCPWIEIHCWPNSLTWPCWTLRALTVNPTL